MKRRTRKLVLIAVTMLLTAVLPPLAGVVAAQWWTARQAENRLGSHAQNAVEHADRILAAARTALDGLAPRLDAHCSDATLASLHQTVYASLYFREAGLIVDDRLVCTSMQRFNPPVPMSGPDLQIPSDDGLHLTAAKLTAESEGSIILLRRIGAHAAASLLVNPLEFGESPEPLSGNAPIQLELDRSDGMPLRTIGLPSADDNGIRISRASTQFPLRVVARAPRAWLLRDALRNAMLFGGLGLLLSALLVWQLLRLARCRLSLSAELRQALRDDELRVHYQPVMDIQNGECVGAEALIRWQHADRGMILPDQFLPAAEKAGLMLPITTWVLQRIADEMAGLLCWNPRFHISLNLSPKLFSDRGLPALITHALGPRIQPWRIVFEITEQHLMNAGDEHVSAAVLALRETGALLALDDFGTGYSSLQSLSQFPFDYLKIDKLFIAAIGTDSATARLVPGIVDLARRLDLTVIAEGVETAEQLDHLRELGVQYVQGWYYSKSLPAEAFRTYVEANRGQPGAHPAVP